MKFLVVYGSVRSNRQGIKAARYVARFARERGHDVVLVDPKERELPLLDRMYKELDDPPPAMEELARDIVSADGVIVVSGEYNHSIPPALTNLMDHYLEEWFWKPALVVTYSAGGFGGVRAGVQLRSFLTEMGMPTVPSMVSISRIGDFDEDDPPERLPKSLSRAMEEFEWYAEAIRDKRAGGTPY